MKAAIYTRVSTDRQDASNQTLQLRQWAEAHGHEVVAEYTDVASGARAREHLDDLLAAARQGEFDLVAIWGLDRLTREGTLQSLFYLKSLTGLGVKVYSHRQPLLDPTQPFYDVVVAVYAEVARLERVQISDRTKAGLARARAQGKRLGRPKGSRDSRKRKRRGYLLRYS